MIYRPIRVIGVVLAASSLLACGADLGRGRNSSAVIDSAGITVVESRSPAWAAAGRRIERKPIVRIGGEDAPYQFGYVVTGLLLSDERIVVPDVMSRDIRVFDFGGSHLRTVGGSGEGPGEFQNPAAVFRYRGDSVAVYDPRLHRATVFPGTFDSQRMIRNEVEANYAAIGTLGSGHILVFDPGAGFRPDLSPGLQWDTTEIVRIDPGDASSRVIVRLPSRQQVVEADGSTQRLVPAHGSIKAAARDGFYWATTDRFEIRFYDREGKLSRILRRPVEPRAVERSMVDAYIEASLERARRFGGDAAVPGQRRSFEDARLGRTVPLFGRAFVDADERLWVSRSVWPSLEVVPRHWSIFSPDGVWLGDLEAPEGLLIVGSRGDLVRGVWRDPMDVPYVELHRIVAADGE